MHSYLVLRLYGPMASWGEVAVGEQRPGAPHPSRSALLGLLGTALGIRRDDEAGQQALGAGYRFGIKLLSAGLPLRDYHTVQWPDLPKKFSYATRRQEMRDPDRLNTILTSRDYRCDSLYTVAIEATADAAYDLAALGAAIERPVFVPYLGRKSCPLALPLNPRLESFPSLKAALDSRDDETLIPEDRHHQSACLRPDRLARYYWDARMDSAGMPVTLRQTRHDEPLSRRRWQFDTRQENVYLAEGRQ